MKASLLLIWICTLGACSIPKNKEQSLVHFDQIGVDNYNSFIYSVKTGWPSQSHSTIDTVGLFCSDRAMPEFDSQKYMQWQELSTDINGRFFIPAATYNNTSTGIKVNDTLLYIHPFREGKFKILQFAPHPLFHNMGAIGNTWAWDLDIGPNWAIDSLYPITDVVETFHITYTFTDTATVPTQFGRLRCGHVMAKSLSSYGISTASYYLNEKYGIVKAMIVCTNGQSFDFALLSKNGGIEGMEYNAAFVEMYRRGMERKLKSGKVW